MSTEPEKSPQDWEVIQKINQDVLDDPNVSPAQRRVAEKAAETITDNLKKK